MGEYESADGAGSVGVTGDTASGRKEAWVSDETYGERKMEGRVGESGAQLKGRGQMHGSKQTALFLLT